MTPINMEAFYAAAANIKKIIAQFIDALTFLINGFTSKKEIEKDDFSF